MTKDFNMKNLIYIISGSVGVCSYVCMFVCLSGMGAQTTGQIWVKLGSHEQLGPERDIG